MDYAHIILYLTFGILPSLIWLFYYLQKDLHPEPKRIILKVFLLGCLVTIPVFFIQIGLLEVLAKAGLPPLTTAIIKWFVIIALTEELFKFVVVKASVLNTYLVDEPLDIMLYMVVAALGFTAVENILYLSPISGASFNIVVQTTVMLSLLRFMGATFLHTLCSALVGYFLALASLRAKKRVLLGIAGITLATLLHGLYDFALISMTWPWEAIIPIAIILALALFTVYDFDGIKKIKGICKL